MSAYLRYWGKMVACAVRGSGLYYSWMLSLAILTFIGGLAYARQLDQGFIVTHLSDQVSWGAYIANFTFLVGVAAAAVLLVVPTYLGQREDIKEVVILGELMAFSAIVMCLMFVTVDLGHPERFIHMMPGLGRLNFPRSILAWDVLVLSGYLVLNLHIPGYLLYKEYKGEHPTKLYYRPFVYLSMGWAVSIHTVTAFLYTGLGSRPYWNSAILAPRFLVSAFASGPALLILVFFAFNRWGGMSIKPSVFETLKKIVSVTLPINMFLFGCEMFKELYTGTTHAASAEYLFLGIHGHGMVVPYMWASVTFTTTAMLVFVIPSWRARTNLVLFASVLCIVGIWIEKGMGLVIPGFIPSPLGDLVEYTPSNVEIFVSLGIWAFGAFLFSALAKVAVAIQRGEVRSDTD